MPLYQGAEFVCEGILDWIDQIVANLDTTHIKPVNGRDSLSMIQLYLIDHKIYRDVLHFFSAQIWSEPYRKAASVLVVRFDWTRLSKLERHEITKVLSRNLQQVIERIVKAASLG